MASSFFLSFLFVIFLLATVCSARPGLHFHPCKTLFISYTFSEDTHNPSSTEYFAVYRVLWPNPIIINHSNSATATDHVRSDLSIGMSSLHERLKDILIVLAGLLFGVGCGVLTSAIMYLVWFFFTNQYEICRSEYGEIEPEENPKKMGYVMISDPMPEKKEFV